MSCFLAKVRLFWANSIVAAWSHPWARHDRFGTFARIIAWQLRSRLSRKPVQVNWIGDAQLVAKTGMHGATGNFYYGLAEFADMAFLLHFLREGDGFADIGANIGSYTVLAAKLRGANVIAFEPAPETLPHLQANISANGIADKVSVRRVALSDRAGTALLTKGDGPMNRLSREDGETQVQLSTADIELSGRKIIAAKIDVEGAEEGLIRRASSLLSEPQLLVIEIESLPGQTREMIESAGFSEWFYDPCARALQAADCGLGPHNHLFIRQGTEDEVLARVRAAPVSEYRGLEI